MSLMSSVAGRACRAVRDRAGVRPWRGLVTATAFIVVVGAITSLVLGWGPGGRAELTIVAGHSMEPSISSGDLVITRVQEHYEIGDVIVYRIPEGGAGAGQKVIHRITGGTTATGFTTAGDNRQFNDPWRPTTEDIVGAHWRTVPFGGLAILWLRSPIALGLLLSIVVFRLTLRFLPPSDDVAVVDQGVVPQPG